MSDSERCRIIAKRVSNIVALKCGRPGGPLGLYRGPASPDPRDTALADAAGTLSSLFTLCLCDTSPGRCEFSTTSCAGHEGVRAVADLLSVHDPDGLVALMHALSRGEDVRRQLEGAHWFADVDATWEHVEAAMGADVIELRRRPR